MGKGQRHQDIASRSVHAKGRMTLLGLTMSSNPDEDSNSKAFVWRMGRGRVLAPEGGGTFDASGLVCGITPGLQGGRLGH